ncbi:MAG TPA: TonB-dependent receptor [Cyclobacteriaceae bacterium]|nr:TonB-dependent receptor [Cyclobacteriaceae bacterium]HNC11820.1 TonB-dependent receptor [Cyclobacteriaceae bacterium]HNE98050.1 TonB-dependent receptor [Cyclobacteriaceae bacterium]HNG40837.1 TonB-dependent receptor [Cyclobacteriaceae bacterium]HNN23931.1 TonB-dependent receptor [Cyclobacteriaceae bacterium]
MTVSGVLADSKTKDPLPFVNVQLKTLPDSTFVSGTITDEHGRFSLKGITAGRYVLQTSSVGYVSLRQSVLVGKLSEFLDLGVLELSQDATALNEVVITGQRDAVVPNLDKKTFNISDNISQRGGSLLQAMQNLPGIAVTNEGTLQLRGSDKVIVLIDGKQTALTGFGNQRGLDNIPASAIEKIEIINNPSSKYDANGNAGIINIVYKKEVKEGLNGKVGLAGGLGALWIKKENFPTIRPQYQATPKINPSVSLNYRKKKVNIFFQADNLYTQTLNKNEFVDRYYDNGDIIRQQTKRNRNTNFVTLKSGIDLYLNERNTLTVSGLFGSEKIIDHGDEPFFNGDFSERLRLWKFLEDELKTTATFLGNWQHKFSQPGRVFTLGYTYTFHRENEKYFFTNITPDFTGKDSFKLLSDEHVTDVTADYVQPLKHGRFELGAKFRRRYIPTNMRFFPGVNSPIDANAGGWANYTETIPALYGNYLLETSKIEVEAGLRVEYVNIQYDVNPDHNTYKSDGYHYTQPFPNLRFAYKLNNQNTLSLFYTRRVDRPNEVDIRIFPKYDDAEIIKVGNPGLRPQFTHSFEAGYKTNWNSGYWYSAVYHKETISTIVRIASVVEGSPLIYNIFQNAGASESTGAEVVIAQDISTWAKLSLNVNAYHNTIEGFTVVNQYPEENTFTTDDEEIWSGNIKVNGLFHLPKKIDVQVTSVYAAPDLVPQGKTYSRFYADLGIRKSIQNGKGELSFNATDVGNTLRIKKRVNGDGFHYISTDYYETQVFRLGYTYKF